MVESTKRSRVGIASGGDLIRFRSYVNHSIYAREHGLDYRLECGVDPQIHNKYHYKISIIRRLLPKYDWLMWIDDDAFFTDFSRDGVMDLIEEAEAADSFLVIAEGAVEPNGFWSKINSGAFIMKNCEKSFRVLDAVLTDSLDEVSEWWDGERDGLYTNGDQDQLWWFLNESGLVEETLIVGHSRLNSRMHYYQSSPADNFIMHFCGWPDRGVGTVMFARKFGLDQDLVPVELAEKYNVGRRNPISSREYAFRLRKMRAISGFKKRFRPTYHRVRDLGKRIVGGG